MKNKIMKIAAVVATIAASVIATSACWFFFYQPEEPESLRDK